MSRLEQRWRVLQSVLSTMNCRCHCSSPGVFTLLVSLSLVVSGMCCSLVGSQMLQSPLTAASLKVLMDGGPLGVQHFSSVFPLVSDGTISCFSCNQVFVVLCRRTGRQRHLVSFVGVSSVRCFICTLCCWYEVWAWLFFVAPGS